MFYLAKDTASQKVLAYLVDATDGYSPETGVSSPTIKISKAAGVGNSPNDGTFAELDSTDLPGWYSVQLDATDTDTLGTLVIDVFKSGTSRHFTDRGYVLPAKVYNSLFAGTDNLEVDTVQVGGTSQTARDLGASVLLSSGTGTGQISLSSGTVSLTADQAVNVTKWGGTAVASAYVQANTVQFAGQTITCAGGVTIQTGIQASQADVTGLQGSVDGLYSGVPCISMSAGVITAAAIAAGAIDADAIADNAIDAGAIATGAITAAKFASAAIDAAAIAPDAGTEIGTAVWASAARTLTAATNITSTGGSVPITVGGKVEADVKAINAVTVDGAGTGGNPWGPA